MILADILVGTEGDKTCGEFTFIVIVGAILYIYYKKRKDAESQ